MTHHSLLSRVGIRWVGRRDDVPVAIEWWPLGGICLIAVVIAGWLAKMLGLPASPGFNGSLLCGPSPVLGLIETIIVLIVAAVIGVAAIAVIADQAGMVVVCTALAAVAVRCGPVRPVLQLAEGAGVFVRMGVESATLFALLAAVWFGLKQVAALLPRQATTPIVDKTDTAPLEWGTVITAVIAQTLAMAIVIMLLLQVDDLKQSMAAVAIAGFVGSMVAYQFGPDPREIFFLIGPALVAIVGSVLAFLNPDGLVLGELHNFTAALSRATPLAYASLGAAGAMLGHWAARRAGMPETT